MHILSWNVNGIRAAIRKGFLDFLKKKKPDILCLQEIKICDEKRRKEFSAQGGPASWNFPGYEEYWNSAVRPGYSGTAILVKTPFPEQERGAHVKGLGKKEFDQEGRVQTLEFKKFYLVNAYFPNANHELSRLDYKLRFDAAILKYVKKLDRKKPVIVCGDFNVAHKEIDLTNPKTNIGNPGFTPKERVWVDKLIKIGYIDTFRDFYPKKIQYSWWSYRFNARVRNIGWRLDYFFVSKRIIKNIKKAFILDKIIGSDHCPVGIEVVRG